MTGSLRDRTMRQVGDILNFKYTRMGPRFEGRSKSTHVQETRYLLLYTRYIEPNPGRAGLTIDPGNYIWSIYQSHEIGKRIRLWSPHMAYLSLDETIVDRRAQDRALVSQSLSVEVVQKIRHCVNTGLALGTEDFRAKVKALRN